MSTLLGTLVQAARNLDFRLPAGQQAVVDTVALAPQGSAATLGGACCCITVLAVQQWLRCSVACTVADSCPLWPVLVSDVKGAYHRAEDARVVWTLQSSKLLTVSSGWTGVIWTASKAKVQCAVEVGVANTQPLLQLYTAGLEVDDPKHNL